ncbi:magnesium transporter CorA family protein [Flavobacterium sp. Fl-77]|uniref:Magnesium transporter CorA family protein n=1 Tax=Flavobacterium flavipigmentatum TaxID=2893884 RepID=A0AAJ2S948_9FLAO|nr:magnesium transporter CorA family protein [Flavobacterium sp. F-70]MDX6182295.1 magnesium transporter CorA family protein [Flavobacterium sp. Fl-33]MDX6185792.1 magnesium transporter CorA family protein [Flavobacterium sp. Fl-77]UFH38972.1 magnesium transporter CorA family protein [Flavobacterium sp. F-70]
MKAFYTNNNGFKEIPKWNSNCWINVEVPTAAEKKYLLEELQIPEAFYNDIEDVDERPRIEIEDGWTLIIMRVPIKSDDVKLPFQTVPMGLIFREDICVTISFYKTEIIADFVLYSQRKNIEIRDNHDLVLRLLLSSSVWYLKYLKQINQKIKLAEDNLEKSIKNEELQALLQIEKCLVFFITSLKGNDVLFHRIKNLKAQKANYDLDLLEDVEIELSQAQDTANIYSNILTGMMDAYASVISNNMNNIMKQMTSISIILMIPTLIASLYGMNVPNGLEESKYGIWILLFVSVVLSAFGVFLFKRRRWF